MDGIRAAMGDKKLNYFGFSYGTFLGATYSSLFPDNYRAMVLDGPVDANSYINTPQADLREQTAGFERALGRFFQACASSRPSANSAAVIRGRHTTRSSTQANMLAIPAPGFTDDPRPVNGDDILNGTLITLYNKGNWPLLAKRSPQAAAGRRHDASALLADAAWGNNLDGTFDPGTDRYFTIGAIEQKYPHDVQTFLDAGDNSWGDVQPLLVQHGLPEINYALWPIHDKDAYYGPFTASKSAPTVLEVATTYDPATPFRGAKRLATQLGNVRFLTMVGDGHTAYRNGNVGLHRSTTSSHTIETLALPPKGTTCKQDVPFVPPPAAAVSATSAHERSEPGCAAAPAPAAHAPLDRLRTRWVRSPGTQRVRLRPHPRGRCDPARAGAGRARVARARVAPGGLVPGRRDLGVEGEAALRDAVGRDQPEGARLDGREVAAPGVAGEVEVAAPEAERVRAAGAVDDAARRAPSRRRPAPTTAMLPLKPLCAEARAPRSEPSGANATSRPSQSSRW